MSSILDALRKLEAAQVQVARQPGVWTEPPRKRRWTGIGIAAAFVTGVGLTLWLSRREVALPPATRDAPAGHAEAHRAAAPVAPAPVAAAPVVAAPVAPAPVTAAAPPAAAVPSALSAAPVAVPAPPAIAPPVVAPPPVVAATVPPPSAPAAAPASPAPAAAALPPAAPAPPLPQAVMAADPPRGRVAPDPAPPVAVAARAPEPVAPPEDAVLAHPPAGAPRIQLSFLIYSSVPARRTVALIVDDGNMALLHEGQTAHGVEVEHIFTDHVQVRHGGKSFAVRTRE